MNGRQEEEWRKIYDFPDYEVSDFARVRDSITGRLLSISANGQAGILKVFLRKAGDPKFYTRSVCRLVAFAFHGDPPEGSVIVYKDDDRSNCRADNLEWKPRWFAQERTMQSKRTRPMRSTKILMESTGIVYENALECAKAIDGIEKYIVLCAGDPINRRYMGSSYRWIYD